VTQEDDNINKAAAGKKPRRLKAASKFCWKRRSRSILNPLEKKPACGLKRKMSALKPVYV